MHLRDDAFERLVIYRYRVSDVGVTRIEPIADNARTSLEEWLSMPWEEARGLSGGNLERLQQVHAGYRPGDDSQMYVDWTVGAVSACGEKGMYQVAASLQPKRRSDYKDAGGRRTTYFLEQETGHGYRVVGVSGDRNPTCNGPDLMAKPNPTK